MLNRVCALLLLLPLMCASARAGETTVGIALTATHGTHRETGGTANAPVIPAPLLTVSHRFKRLELAAEGLPPIGPIGVANNGLGMRDIALTFADATLRYWNRPGTLAFGFGETLYNQRTTYLTFQNASIRENEFEQSRVAGTRYEAVGRLALNARDFFEAQLAVDPALHGRLTYTTQYVPAQGTGFGYTSRPVWERASEVDGNLRFVHRFGAYAVSYGVHYLNYTAAFTGRVGRRPFADANALVMPYVSLERSWGR